MPGSGRLLMFVTLSAAALFNANSASAFCPFCPPAQPTISEQLADCDLAVLVKWNRLIEQTGELAGAEPQTEFVVLDKPLRATRRPPKPEVKIVVNFRRDGKPGDWLLLIGKDVDGVKQWDIKDVSEASYGYIKQAPDLEQPVSRRLEFFLKWLEIPDPLIANDAFAEFAQAKYPDVAQLAPKLPRDKLRRWLNDPADSMAIRHGFYGLLLGLCGNEEDARYLAGCVLPPPVSDKPRLGIDGMMAGYVLLTGERGLKQIVDAKLRVAQRIDVEVLSTATALRFLWEFAPNRVPRTEVSNAMRLLLNDPKYAGAAIVDLARWQDWDIAPQVIANYGKPPFDDRGDKERVIQFALTAQKYLSKQAEPPKTLTEVRAFLERVRRDEPDVVRTAEQFLNPSPFPKTDPPRKPLEGNLDDRPAGAANGRS